MSVLAIGLLYGAATLVVMFSGMPIAFALGLFDKGVREAHGHFWKEVLRNPARLFQPMYVQSIGIIQGPDLLQDGRVDMCESCPDMTVWDGKLVHSCRMDEWRLYGSYIQPQPRQVAEGELIDAAGIPVNGREPSPN